MDRTDDSEDVIVRDSIIKNKERTKSYWEQLMMAAASESQANGKTKVWDSTDSNSNNRVFKNFNNSLNSFHSNQENGNCKDDIENETMESLKNRLRAGLSYNSLSMEDRIALELQDQKEREEELKQLRKQLSLESSKDLSSSKDILNGNEELYSIHTNDDSNYSEYGSEEKEHSLDGNNSRVNTPYSEDFVHRRTQSLDSVSSGHSSGSASTLNDKDRDSPRRKIMVRPYEDPEEEEEVPAYKRNENETPIEREIRIAKEREEELRKEKGITSISIMKPEQVKIQRSLSKKDAVENDPRDVQHRLATNRIQQEIEEANERENELRTEGKILTTSEETLDAKVTRFTQLAEFAILENRHKDSKMKRSLSVSQLTLSDYESRGKEVSTPVKTSVSTANRRYAPNPAQKGIMQRFIANKGRLSLPINAEDTTNYKTNRQIRRPYVRSLTDGVESFPARKGYIPAGEKIQEELKEMEKREEELRLQRAYNPMSSMTVRHRSQPNLLNLSDDDGNNREDNEELHSWTSHEETRPKPAPRLAYSLSNPNLLDDSLEKMNVRLPNKRFSLLQQWENRIQGAQ